MREIQSIGKRTREWIVDAGACPLLKMHQISAVGISEAARGFRFLRGNPAISVVMGCSAGQGLALIDGKYKVFQPDMAYLMPPHVRHGYEATGKRAWRVCWVCYVQSPEQVPAVSSDKPRLVRTDARPLEEAIHGLFRETIGEASASIQKHYIELIHEYALRTARNSCPHDRLWKLWASVESDLAHDWTLEELGREAGMSIELLRILSHQSTGRSPMKQLAFLRMQNAAAGLASTDDKISAVAGSVGYSDPFAFSVAFKRHIGIAPGAYRTRKRSVSIHSRRHPIRME